MILENVMRLNKKINRYPSGFFPPPKRVAEVPPNIKADVDLRRRPATAALSTPISFLPSDDALPRPYPAAVEKKRSSSGSLSAEVVNALVDSCS